MDGRDRESYFRPDIEGLRAVAIGAVLLFHAGVPLAGGGFVGVDVFFVISGFLITGLLVREWSASGRIDLSAFYARRFRRLLPAALLVIAATTAASYLVLPEVRFPAVAGDAASAALYVSNVRFAATAVDYLGSEVAPSPLLHFWSLSVEEQFYLFWPLVILLSLRVVHRPRIGLLIGAVVVVSFWLGLIWTDLAAPWAFFSLPTRAWELGVGALIAIGVLRLPRRIPGAVASSVVWLGLAMVAASVVILGTSTPYPGTAALLPVLGTALVIIGGGGSLTLPSRLLAMALPRWIGRISYAIYLWHWPILLLVPIALGVDDLALSVALIPLVVVVAWVSTEALEVPIREGRLLRLPPRASVAVAGTASVAVALVAVTAAALVVGPGLAPVSAQGARTPIDASGARALTDASGALALTDASGARAPSGAWLEPVRQGPLPPDLTPSLPNAYYDLPRGYADGCHLDYATVEPGACTYGSAAAGTLVVLLGDSHAQQWLPALEALADARGWHLRAVTKGGCPMVEATVWNGPLKRPYRECDAWRERALQLLEEDEPELVVVASANMYDLVDGEGRVMAEGGEAAWDAGLAVYLARVAERAERVVVLADTPRVGYDPAQCLAAETTVETCDTSAERMIDGGYRAREAEAARKAHVGLVSTTEWLCPGDDCPLVRGPFLVYRDSHHLTATFAAQLAGELGAALDAMTGGDLAGP